MKRLILGLTATSLTALLALSACQTAPKDGGLLPNARNAVAHAEQDPNVTKYAPTELDRARKLLINAEGAAKDKGATDKVASHYAYLATQMARIAEQRAHEQVAMARIKSGETERQKILLSARENEANQAKALAAQARNEAQNAQAQLAQQQAESQRLAAQMENLQASQTSRGIVLTLGDVLFDTGRAELKPGAVRPIEQIAAFLAQHPERKVQIEGFTDSQGGNDYNLELSQKRADAVAMAIIQRGVEAERVRALGYGEEFPKASNTSDGSRQLNRRVEIIVSNGDSDIPGRTAAGSP
jgi:outer membrane protein OmpA-like peptidoglycan-associated protein